MSVTYEEAIATLKAMFEGADEATLKSVLQANGVHMERSIEQLLRMAGDEQQIAEDQSQPGGSVLPSTGATPGNPAMQDVSLHGGSPPQSNGHSGAPLQGRRLPAGFLQLDSPSGPAPEDEAAIAASQLGMNGSAGGSQQEQTDEQLAAALQSEEYTEAQREMRQARARGFLGALIGAGAQEPPAMGQAAYRDHGASEGGGRSSAEGPSGTGRHGLGSGPLAAHNGSHASDGDFDFSRIKRAFADFGASAKLRATELATKCIPRRHHPDDEDDNEGEGLMHRRQAPSRMEVEMSDEGGEGLMGGREVEAGGEGMSRRRRGWDDDGL